MLPVDSREESGRRGEWEESGVGGEESGRRGEWEERRVGGEESGRRGEWEERRVGESLLWQEGTITSFTNTQICMN